MRISDWSSDVCSSDLALLERLMVGRGVGPPLVDVLAKGQPLAPFGIVVMDGRNQIAIPDRLVELVQHAMVQDAELRDVGIYFFDVAGIEHLDADRAGLGEIRDRARIEPSPIKPVEIGRASGRERGGQYV